MRSPTAGLNYASLPEGLRPGAGQSESAVSPGCTRGLRPGAVVYQYCPLSRLLLLKAGGLSGFGLSKSFEHELQ